jgi:hypothetical protein
MSIQRQLFRSAIDVWLVIPGVFAVLAGLVASQARGVNRFSLTMLVLALALVGWVLATTHYTVTDHELIVRSGPIRRCVEGHTIQRVRESRTLLGAQALSMKRIEVTGAFGSVVISPHDRPGFIQALRRIAPHMTVDDALLSGRLTRA